MVVMTNSDNGSILAEALIRRAANSTPGRGSGSWKIKFSA
jgi:hypothetical protein